MALDNPSYFTITSATESTTPSSLHLPSAFTNMGAGPSKLDNISNSSQCSLNRQLTPPRCGYYNKNGARTLLRSNSSNSADSNQELLIMGEPRLSDIAPDVVRKHPNNEVQRSNSLRNKKVELQCHDLMYFPLPTEDVAVSEFSGDEEVFISEDSARYYNLTAISNTDPNIRRHSISTFTTRERSASVASSSRSFKEDFPQAVVHATVDGKSVAASSSINIDDHSLRHGSYPRKRCNRCTKKPISKRVDMDDILIVSVKQSSAAKLWVDYFNWYFQHICKQANRKPFKILHLGVEEIIETNADVKIIEERTSGVKLQLIVMCPTLLESIANNPNSATKLGKLILPDRTLALLLGVSDDDFTDVHKHALPTYPQWQRLGVGMDQDQDENFTKEFLGTAVSILSKIWKQQTSIVPQQKSLFSVVPKKVRQGHNSVVIILTHPLQREDIIKVSIERNNEIVEIKSVKRRNPYTLKVTVPDSCTEVSAIVHILVEKNGSIIGSSPIKCESRLRELEQILRSSDNPVEFMSQALGFSPSNKEHMDNCLVYSFQRNLPPNFNLLFNQSSVFASSVYAHRHGHEEYPTLLHFAARYGLEKLAMQLLECPGGDVACDIKNSCDLTPAEIAQYSGHSDLAHLLSGYMKMNEFKNVYEKLKEMSQQNKHTNNEGEDESGYLLPKDLSNNYKACPPPKPFSPSITAPPPEKEPINGYMTMNNVPAKPDSEVTQPLIQKNLTLNLNCSPSTSKESSPSISQKDFNIYEDKVQKELLEIINDFKNNVHSISQVEKLVEEWKNRNDVQKSFKEKQQQLNEMRMRYDKIQQDMKANMKKATPFERVKKLFYWGKSKDCNRTDNSTPSPSTTPASTPTSSTHFAPSQSHRPISSLSLQSTSSSGSSGRMSTISGCSIGDSGTHSDQEERKNMLGNSHDEDFRNDLNKAIINLNYTVPPPPRPFHPVKFSAKNKAFPTIEERPPQPVPRPVCPDSDIYYIEFPPSGLPVPVEQSIVTSHTDNKNIEQSHQQHYMNTPNLRGNSESEEFHEYMNYKSSVTEIGQNVNKFLLNCLKDAALCDEFSGNLYKIHRTILEEGVAQNVSLGSLRSDYIAHKDAGNRINQVELNTIASRFAATASQFKGLNSSTKKMDKKFLLICIAVSIAFVVGQRKPGRCPASLNIPICAMTCYNDMHCMGNNKCCRTNCNGALCVQPIPEQAAPLVSNRKPGNCPSPLRVSICAMTCPNDMRCNGKEKCCRTECGGSVCIAPLAEQQITVPPPVPTNVCPAKPGGPWKISFQPNCSKIIRPTEDNFEESALRWLEEVETDEEDILDEDDGSESEEVSAVKELDQSSLEQSPLMLKMKMFLK
ncbi:hypothetical protein RN001_004443 [Aquatica leii]|uniref:DBB domain-containing protein n=1 Tax=Aquatica leii TaxID=1421715 RepID=A0AAN7PBD1_9COLE|nr:hypothetical protein RN001_004443 [Aquatica leii]